MSNIIKKFKNDYFKIHNYFISENLLNKKIHFNNISFEISKSKTRGNLSTNLLLIYKKYIKLDYKKFEVLIKRKIMSLNYVKKVEIAKQGFINIFFKNEFLFKQLKDLYKLNEKYGTSDIGKKIKINIEFVSANPTGPLHVAHARGAVFGDVLSNMMESVGYNVVREYYINDTGKQVQILGESLFIRYKQELNIPNQKLSDDSYPGDYLIDIAKEIIKKDGDKWISKNINIRKIYFQKYATEKIIKGIKNDLKFIGIKFNNFISEKNIVQKKYINDVFKKLKEENLLYEGILQKPKIEIETDWEPRKQLLFKSTKYGDDLDRPLQKSNNEWTYFANDAAYHYYKITRGFDRLVNIWGSDHIGYIKRMKSMVSVLSDKKILLDIKICQLVHLKKDNKPIKISKRKGNFITIKEIADDVGSDVLRFYMLYRKNDTQMDFDISKVKLQTKDNPIFYIQYAYARSMSVLNMANSTFSNIKSIKLNLKYNVFNNYISTFEWEIINQILFWPQLVENIVATEEPHKIIYYLENLASLFHIFWNQGKDDKNLRFIDEQNIHKTTARIYWIGTMQIVFRCAFEILGIKLVDRM